MMGLPDRSDGLILGLETETETLDFMSRDRDRDLDKMNSSALESRDHGLEITTLGWTDTGPRLRASWSLVLDWTWTLGV